MVGPAFATMTGNVQAAEGELKAQFAHLHAYAEEVCMLHGGGAEAQMMAAAMEGGVPIRKASLSGRHLY